MKTKDTDLIMQNKVFLWIIVFTVFVLSIPLIAMQLTTDVNWGLEDFIVIGTLLLGAGTAFVLTARVTPRKYRILVALGFLTIVLWLWAELAVGIFTNWGS